MFTLASAWCGFSGDVSQLIVARVFQGLGASMMTPQTMAIITRIFPPNKRGQAMGLWDATAGVATLVGPVLGGVLVDSLGWEWIFFVNLPIGVGLSTVGFTITSMSLPLVFYFPLVLGYAPTQPALMLIPMVNTTRQVGSVLVCAVIVMFFAKPNQTVAGDAGASGTAKKPDPVVTG